MIGSEDLEKTRATLWWGQKTGLDAWEATDATGCRYLVSQIYPDRTSPAKWGSAWVDGDFMGISRELHDTRNDAMSYVELLFASNEERPA